MLFGILSFLRAIQDLPTEGPGSFSEFLSFSFSPRNNCFTSVEKLTARESCGLLIQTVLSCQYLGPS